MHDFFAGWLGHDTVKAVRICNNVHFNTSHVCAFNVHHLCSACTRAHCCRYHIKAVNTIRLALLNLNDGRQFPAVSPVQKHISNFLPF